MEVLNRENLISGFKATGIFPFCANEVIKKLPSENNQENGQSLANVSVAVLLDHLKSLRNPENLKPHQKRKRVDVQPGKSVCKDDLVQSESDSDSSSLSLLSSSSEKPSGSSDEEENQDEDEKIPVSSYLQEIEYEAINVDQWVKVVYEDEVFVGIVREKRGGQVKVQCLNNPFGIKVPQLFENKQEAVFYKHVYQQNVKPTLKKFGRGWKYVYE